MRTTSSSSATSTPTPRRTRSSPSRTPGFTNLVEDYLGDDAYSYVFDGQWGYLDHALGSPSVMSQVTGVAEYHINSDEPTVLDYNTDFKTPNLQASLYAPNEFRVSDHDPVIVGLSPTAPLEAAFADTRVGCGDGNASLTRDPPVPLPRRHPLGVGRLGRRHRRTRPSRRPPAR